MLLEAGFYIKTMYKCAPDTVVLRKTSASSNLVCGGQSVSTCKIG